MIFRLSIVVAVMAFALMAGTADACGYKCKTPKPTPTPEVCVCPTPTTAPTVAPTVPPPVPAQFSVTPLPAVVPAVAPEAQATAGFAATAGNGPRLSEYCHYEPTTGNWEIRLSTDVARRVSEGGELPVAPHVCDQHQPLHAPFVEMPAEAPQGVVEAPVPMPELPPVIEEQPMPEQPVVTPPEEAPITVDVETVTVPESVPVCVPVQIPGGEPC